VGGKSPLTGSVKEANAGGNTGLALSHLGSKALILDDQPQIPGWLLIHLSKAGIRFKDASHLAGLGVYESAKKLIQQYGKKVAIALIGPGGEMKLSSAGIQNLDKDGIPSRIAARGGLGAVMGSKGIKAIVIDASKGDKPPIADMKACRSAQNAFNKALLNHPQTQTYYDYGTAAMANMANTFGCLPTRKFSAGEFEGIEKISGEYMRQLMLDRGGESATSHACMRG